MNGMMSAGMPKLQDPVLQQIETGIEAKVRPELKMLYQSIVTAAMSIMFGQATHGLMQKRLASDPDVTKAVSSAVADLIAGIYNKIGPKLPPQDKKNFLPAAALASVSLMCMMLDYSEKTSGARITDDMAAKCTQMTTSALLAKFGVGPDKVQKAMQLAQQKAAGGVPAAPAMAAAASPTGAGGMMAAPVQGA